MELVEVVVGVRRGRIGLGWGGRKMWGSGKGSQRGVDRLVVDVVEEVEKVELKLEEPG